MPSKKGYANLGDDGDSDYEDDVPGIAMTDMDENQGRKKVRGNLFDTASTLKLEPVVFPKPPTRKKNETCSEWIMEQCQMAALCGMLAFLLIFLLFGLSIMTQYQIKSIDDHASRTSSRMTDYQYEMATVVYNQKQVTSLLAKWSNDLANVGMYLGDYSANSSFPVVNLTASSCSNCFLKSSVTISDSSRRLVRSPSHLSSSSSGTGCFITSFMSRLGVVRTWQLVAMQPTDGGEDVQCEAACYKMRCPVEP
eukprot:TRINITY_DN5767_c0_g1_i2.p1 TRINITY_DN5767_c0_g1~~TRINITY_DN5767_c0_g1_i2.p1  ORF type:complete len:294 (+),score=44.51 TRINITY_DN5767_c0_g1_i2:127-882(+)